MGVMAEGKTVDWCDQACGSRIACPGGPVENIPGGETGRQEDKEGPLQQ